MSSALTSMAKEADLLLTGILAEDAAANVAEYYDIPLATLHFAPLRANGQSCRSCLWRSAGPSGGHLIGSVGV